MTTTITGTLPGSTPRVPDVLLWDSYDATQEGRNVFTPIEETSRLAVTLRAAGPRKGTMTAVFATFSAAQNLATDLAKAQTLTLVDTLATGFNMTFALSGKLRVHLDATNLAQWLVTFDFQEIL